MDVCTAAPWSDVVPATVDQDAAMFPPTSDGRDANVHDAPQFHSTTTYSMRLISSVNSQAPIWCSGDGNASKDKKP